MKKINWLVAVVIVAVAVYYFVQHNENKINTQDESSHQTASLEQQKQCSADGESFFQKWLSRDMPNEKGWSYDDPEYHYNGKINACLVYVSDVYVMPFISLNTPVESSHFIYIYDVYANKPILQSVFNRECNTPDPCTEKLQSSSYPEIPNLDSSTFFNQKAVLMSE